MKASSRSGSHPEALQKLQIVPSAPPVFPSHLMQEIFGPVLAVYVYPEKQYKDVLRLIDGTSQYGLTGAVFAQDK